MDKFVYVERDKITANGEILYRIVANRDIVTPHTTILKGEKGGYIAKDTLSNDGNSWVDKNSKILKGSYVGDDAYVSNSTIENAFVSAHAIIIDTKIKSVNNSHSTISGNSKVVNSVVKGAVEMYDETRLDTCNVNGYLKMHNNSNLINCNITTDHLEVFNAETVIGRKITGAGNLQTVNVENHTSRLGF